MVDTALVADNRHIATRTMRVGNVWVDQLPSMTPFSNTETNVCVKIVVGVGVGVVEVTINHTTNVFT